MAALKLMDDTKARFMLVSLMDTLDVVYPQYWIQGDYEDSFWKRLTILEDYYCEPKYVSNGAEILLIPPLLDQYRLEVEQPLFKVAMINKSTAALEMPPLGSSRVLLINPLTKIWRVLDGNSTLNKCFP